MYQSFYNFDTAPFDNTPDPRFFFAGEHHREVLAAIEYVVRLRKGIALVTGPVGSGKTTVGRTMCERCVDQATVVHLFPRADGSRGLTRQVLRALALPVRRNEEHSRTLERLHDALMDHLYSNRPVVLFVDEAQLLSDESLEEIRLLANFDTATQKPVQVVLVGHSELRARLRRPSLDALRQRIIMAKEIRPLSLSDTRDYIDHRLRVASRPDQALGVQFTESAVREIHEFSQGLPRVINAVCDNCLLLAFVKEQREIQPGVVRRVVSDLLPSFSDGVNDHGVDQTLEVSSATEAAHATELNPAGSQ